MIWVSRAMADAVTEWQCLSGQWYVDATFVLTGGERAMKLLIICVDLVALAALPLSWWIAKKSTVRPASVAPSPRWRHGSWWARMAAYVLLVAVALIPIALLDDRLFLIPVQSAGYHVHRDIPDARLETHQSCPTSAQTWLTLTIRGADVAQDTVEADAALCVGDQALRHLWFSTTGTWPFAQGLTPRPADKRALQATFAVIYGGSLPNIIWTRRVSIGEMLKQREPFSQRVREPIHIGTLTLPLLGSADDYPFDDYAAAGNWTVTVPDGTEIVFPGSI